MQKPEFVEISPEEFPQHVADQLLLLWRQVARQRGTERGFRHIIHALIASHPNPSGLRDMLVQTIPELVDELTDNTEDNELRAAAMEATTHEVGLATKLVDAVMASRGQ